MRKLISAVSGGAIGLCVVLAIAGGVTAQEAEDERSISRKMNDVIDPVVVDSVAARQAFEWWSQTTNIPLVINWGALEQDGIDPSTPISLDLRYVPAGQLLGLMMRMLPSDPGQELLYETTPWYVQVMTKEMANKQVVIRVYDIRDLLHEIPSFDDAPTMDLNEALSNTNSGGGGSSVSTGLFGDSDGSRGPVKSKAEQGDELAQLIRETIEPEIWQENGGEYASIRHFNGRLIVNAPLYVHAQIGIPEVASRPGGGNRAAVPQSRWATVKPLPRNDVAAVQQGPADKVGGVGH